MMPEQEPQISEMYSPVEFRIRRFGSLIIGGINRRKEFDLNNTITPDLEVHWTQLPGANIGDYMSHTPTPDSFRQSHPPRSPAEARAMIAGSRRRRLARSQASIPSAPPSRTTNL